MIEIKSDRNFGIDLLRIIAMVMITTHHVLLHGGILGKATHFSMQYSIVWFIEAAGLCGVNIYGLISGYVGYDHEHRPFRFLQLYFQVLFYTLTTTIIFAIFWPDLVTGETIRNAVIPFAFNMYWYYTAFFCLFFFMPFLDKMIDVLTISEAKKLIIALFVVFSVLQTVFRSQFALTNDGYSFLWLAVLYLGGAYIRKYDIGMNSRWGLSCYLLSVFFIWTAKMAQERISHMLTQEYIPSVWLTYYISPFVVLSAIFLLLTFRDMRIGSGLKRLISFFAPVSFDVYLLQDEPLIRNTFILGAFAGYLKMDPIVMTITIIGTAIGIWSLGNLVGQIRKLFFKLLRVECLCSWGERQVNALLGRFG